MLLQNDYRPKTVEFEVANSSIVPDNLGKYETAKEEIDFYY
jgi:hypothetical protein